MSTGDSELKLVRFDIWCKTCKYHERKEKYDPCNECLETGMREGTSQPEEWVAAT